MQDHHLVFTALARIQIINPLQETTIHPQVVPMIPETGANGSRED